MRVRLIALSLFVSAAMAMPAHAASSTATAPIRVQNPNGIWCGVTNVSSKPIDVSIDIVGSTGAVLSGGPAVNLAPGETAGPAASSPAINGFVYCRANGFSSKKVHVTTCVVTSTTIANGNGECLGLTAAP